MQSPLLSELAQIHAENVKPFQVINAVAATISAAEVDRLSQDPSVKAVVPAVQRRRPTRRPRPTLRRE